MSQTIKVINQEIDNLSTDEISDIVTDSIRKREFVSIATVNPEFLVSSVKNHKFAHTLSKFNIKTADGFGVLLMSALFGHRFSNRVTGVDMTYKLIDIANKNKYKVVMVGASEDSALKACNKIRYNYPSLQIDCIGGGVIDPNIIDKDLAEQLHRYKPDILFVGLGSPKQEFFIENAQKKIGAPVAMGVGGTIDFISGVAHRAPKWLRSIGLEWLWRLFTQPRRLSRIITATIIFPLYYLRWIIFGRDH